MRSYRFWVWTMLAVTTACVVADTILLVAWGYSMYSNRVLVRHGWPLINLASLGSALLGAMILLRYRTNSVGWLLSVVGISGAVSMVTETIAVHALEESDGDVSRATSATAHFTAWLGGPLALALLTYVFLLVPDGHWLARRWKYVGAAAALGYVLFTFGIWFADPMELVTRGGPSDTPGLAQWLANGGVILVTLSLLASLGAMVARLRRATDEERQQIKWVLSGAVAVGLGLVSVLVTQSISPHDREEWWTNLPLFLGYIYLLIAITIAILRYRLYDIDVIINRAVVLAGATAFVIAAYVGVVIVVGGALDNWTDGFWLSLVVTVAVAVAFQPLRYHLVRLANRFAYGKQAAPYDALADFSRQLGISPDPAVLLPAIAEAAGRATLATMAVVRLGPTDRPTRVVTWPDETEAWSAPAGAIVELPVADQAGPLGAISVAPPPGMTLRNQDLRLLRDIANQAAVAFRNLGLEIELAAHVVLLDEQTDKLAASRRRLISASDAERRRLESAISREVLPTLSELRGELERIRESHDDGASTAGLVDDATRALESLRELTRGVYPTLLTRAGIAAALTSYFSRQGRRADLTIEGQIADRRFAERVEVAAYYCCTQAVSGISGPSQVRLSCDDDWLQIDLQVTETALLDLEALTDRVEACGGSIEIDDQTWVASNADMVVRLPAQIGQRPTVADSHA